jgi:hypothetical protein
MSGPSGRLCFVRRVEMTDQPREVIGIVWRKGNRVEVTYAGGDVDGAVASLDIVTAMAAEEGLILVPTPDGTMRWVKDPPAWNVDG